MPSHSKSTFLSCCAILFGSLVMQTSVNAAEFPATVVDDRNIVVTVKSEPKKLASLGTFAADLAKSFGIKPVGTTTYNGVRPIYLGESLDGAKDFGSIQQPNLELMTESGVDLVIGLRRYTEPYADDFTKFAPYLAYELLTYEDSKRAVASAATALGQGQKGVEINNAFEETLNDYSEKAPGGISAMFVWMWQDTPYAYYDHPMPASYLGALKARNVMGANPNVMMKENFGVPLSFEDLLTKDPEVLIMFRAEGNEYPNNPVFQRLKSVKNSRAYHVGYQYSQPTGPLAREIVLKEIAHLLYPDTFEKPDLPKGVAAEPVRFEK